MPAWAICRNDQRALSAYEQPHTKYSEDRKTVENLPGEERKDAARKLEIYAAMIENLDWNVGRLFARLKELSKFDDTIIFFLSDNGANPKGPFFYPLNTKESIAKRCDKYPFRIKNAPGSSTRNKPPCSPYRPTRRKTSS